MDPDTVQALFGRSRALNRLLLSLLVVHLAACAGMQPLSIDALRDPTADAPLAEGDRIEILTKRGEKLEFAITEISTEGLGGQFGFVRYDEMRRVRVERPGGAGQSQWIWSALGVAALIALVAAADSVSACSPGPCSAE